MLSEEQRQRIEGLYIEYQQEIKLLMFYVESKYHKFPRGQLKEFRDVFDHISRCYVSDISDDKIEENILKAENHFTRIKLDTYKYLHDYKSQEYDIWKKKYSKYDMERIHDGQLWVDILELEDEAEDFFDKARKVEQTDINKAFEYLQESTARYADIDEIISSNRELIVKVKWKHRIIFMAETGVAFVIGVIASLVATWILQL